MRPNDKVIHPEIIEFMHICAVSPEAEGAKEICELLNSTKKTSFKKNKKRSIKDKKLDQELKDTFPASDPITHY